MWQPIFPMFCSLSKFQSIRLQVARFFRTLNHIYHIHHCEIRLIIDLGYYIYLFVCLLTFVCLIVDLAPPPKLRLELFVCLSFSCQAAFQRLQQNIVVKIWVSAVVAIFWQCWGLLTLDSIATETRCLV